MKNEIKLTKQDGIWFPIIQGNIIDQRGEGFRTKKSAIDSYRDRDKIFGEKTKLIFA